MAIPHTAASSRAGHHRPGTRATVTTAVALALALLAAGCSSGTGDGASRTEHRLGRVPVPSPPTAQATPTASEDHLQLVAIGAPVRATLPGNTSAVVTALGPDEATPTSGPTPPQQARGTFTVTLTDITGALTVHAADFSSRDEQGHPVTLTTVGPATVTATTGHPAALRLVGTFSSGAAQLTWRHDAKVITIWDFNVELD
jgi:hypothetical protein